jgi:hypothetical protein
MTDVKYAIREMHTKEQYVIAIVDKGTTPESTAISWETAAIPDDGKYEMYEIPEDWDFDDSSAAFTADVLQHGELVYTFSVNKPDGLYR